jgi:asparagine synthase (glutamine-hydrolysing)
MSMAASLELRPPFLDHRLVDLAFRLDPSLKLRGRTGKWVVKELARRHLPPEIVDRPKSGFVVPLHSWFRGDLRSESRDRLLAADSFVSEVMDRAVVRSMLDDHARGRRDETARLWTLMCLETWHGAFFRSSTRAHTATTG